MKTIRSLVLAAAAFVAMSMGQSAHAFVVNPADFIIVESPGQYTVYNNSSDWYIYAFAVSNSTADDPGIIAVTTFPDWGALTTVLDLGHGPLPAFAYASKDVDLSDISNPILTATNLANYIAPNTSSDLFFFSTLLVESDFGMLLVGVENDVTQFGEVNGVATNATPVPAALPLFAGGLGVIGLVARRRKRKAALAAA